MPDNALNLALAALFVPLIAAFLIAVLPELRKKGAPAGWLSVVAALVALGASLMLFQAAVAHGIETQIYAVRWIPTSGASLANVGIRLDGIAVSMLVVVTLVAACVQVFSLGYMAEEPPAAFGRYFGYHSLFIFSMNLLVLAPNLLELFAGWELVGLTSYLLIGFYYQKPSAARAAVKAFWFTKFADMGLLLGVILLYQWTRSFSWNASLTTDQANVVALLLFLAVMGKSAQFPLHVWLPDAMEGPTPVSALLHAATMVAAGVYLVVRSNPLFMHAPLALDVMANVGAFTALFAAIIAFVQTDIKKVLAYSTCSQLGYMIAALGAGSLMAGFFHLTTHAAFKALLFLAAGSVIHAVHSNEMSDMGGLFKKMPVTAIVFIIGSAALAGIPPFAGFFSKDLILEAMEERHLMGPLVALLAGVFLTAGYMTRAIALTFFGKPSKKASHAHESGTSMVLPMVVLAALALGLGFFAGGFAKLYGVELAPFQLGPLGMLSLALALSGVAVSWMVFGSGRIPQASFGFLAPVGALARSAAVDRMYVFLFRRVGLVLANAVGWFDRYVVDGLMNFIGWLAIKGGQRLRRTQTGNVQDYVYAVFAGAVVFVAWAVVAVSRGVVH